MIKLIGVIAKGGLPVTIKALIDIKHEELIGGMLEAIRVLSSVMGGKKARMLDFGEDKLVMSESSKGYTVIALVDRAEVYIGSLVRLIASRIDSSDIEEATGLVYEDTIRKIENIIDTYVTSDLNENAIDMLLSSYKLILDELMKEKQYLADVRSIEDSIKKATGLREEWEEFRGSVQGDFADSVKYALEGNFGIACAIGMKSNHPIARLFAVKMGLLSLSMSNTITPTIHQLKELADQLDTNNIFHRLVKTALEYRAGEATLGEYINIFRECTKEFDFEDTLEGTVLGFLFVDEIIGYFPDFGKRLMDYFRDKSDVIYTYIEAILDRRKIFDKIYSITSFEEFREDLAIWRTKIDSVLEEINNVLFPSLEYDKKYGGQEYLNRISISRLLNLQTYIALLTALAESPILSPTERKDRLEEVFGLYKNYVRKILRSNVPMFNSTLMNIFQSISVVLNELYYLKCREEREKHYDEIFSFLRDVEYAIENLWMGRLVDFSLLSVLTNALFPILSKREGICGQEVKIIYTLLKFINRERIIQHREVRPYGYAVIVGNMANTLASIITRMENMEARESILKKCLRRLIENHKWFLSQGVICRDDIITMTYNMTRSLDIVDWTRDPQYIEAVIGLNQIAMINTEKYDYETAIIAEEFLGFLAALEEKLNIKKYRTLAEQIFQVTKATWKKYGFTCKATNMEHH